MAHSPAAVDTKWRMRASRLTLSLAVAIMAVAALPTHAAALSLEPIGGYASPVYVTSDPSDESRIFVVEQDGRIQLTAGGTTTEFLDIDSTVLSNGEPGAGDEQGLFSMAFAPDYAANGRFYLDYTGMDGAVHVAELTAHGDAADPASLRDVLTIPHPAQIHNGGQLQFGPDGLLYVSVGDGGSSASAQDPGSLLGKLLRIAPTPGGGHTLPVGNPFGNEVWSSGLRNPWRFAFDRATGDLWIGDVGQSAFEEVDRAQAPAAGGRLNFGWPCREGFGAGPGGGCAGALADPVFAYANDASTCAITGGYVVRDAGLTELYGRYVYADLCAGVIRSFDPADPFGSDRSEGLGVSTPTSFGEDACGRIYVVSHNGAVSRLVDGTPTECPVIDAVAPGITLDGKHKQSIADRKLTIKATATEQAAVSVSAQVDKQRHGNPKQVFELDSEQTDAPAGTVKKLTWKLTRGEARRVRRLIERHRRVVVGFDASATDAAGNTSAASLQIRLKLP